MHDEDEREAYDGQEDATVDRVARYLRDNYGPNDAQLTEEQLLDLVAAHASTIRQAIEMGSFAYYAGDEIADAAGLDYIGPDES
ncbi:hypothetical protein [Micromonospora maritima]|uniref:hypothetical protein n=1 Tax=Micromonospora maritima TaxID=986711 RepID=UPI00157C0604|nr:hypothetical protein [Micromonospora maritima]